MGDFVNSGYGASRGIHEVMVLIRSLFGRIMESTGQVDVILY